MFKLAEVPGLSRDFSDVCLLKLCPGSYNLGKNTFLSHELKPADSLLNSDVFLADLNHFENSNEASDIHYHFKQYPNVS